MFCWYIYILALWLVSSILLQSIISPVLLFTSIFQVTSKHFPQRHSVRVLIIEMHSRKEIQGLSLGCSHFWWDYLRLRWIVRISPAVCNIEIKYLSTFVDYVRDEFDLVKDKIFIWCYLVLSQLRRTLHNTFTDSRVNYKCCYSIKFIHQIHHYLFRCIQFKYFLNMQNNFSWNNLPESFPVLSMPVSSYLEDAL